MAFEPLNERKVHEGWIRTLWWEGERCGGWLMEGM